MFINTSQVHGIWMVCSFHELVWEGNHLYWNNSQLYLPTLPIFLFSGVQWEKISLTYHPRAIDINSAHYWVHIINNKHIIMYWWKIPQPFTLQQLCFVRVVLLFYHMPTLLTYLYVACHEVCLCQSNDVSLWCQKALKQEELLLGPSMVTSSQASASNCGVIKLNSTI